jgi:integrase
VATVAQWLRRVLRFHALRHPRERGSADVNASTQNQALSALLFLYRELTVRHGKGGKDRRTLLPASQCQALQEHLEHVRRLHQQDLAAGWGAVALPYALARKYRHADRQWGLPWVFPQRNRWQDAATGHEGRHTWIRAWFTRQ